MSPVIQKPRFQKFIANIFGGGRRMRQNLKREFNPSQINHLAQKLKLNLDAKPRDLALEQWIAVYRFSQTRKVSISENSTAGFSQTLSLIAR